MTAEIVNLRTIRKRKVRADKASVAAANRIAHGISKAERDKAARQQALDARRLEGVRRSLPSDDGQS
jgi:hypothetical protein